MTNLAYIILWVLAIVQQPQGERNWVSINADVATRFALIDEYGSEAYLAHDYLAGGLFYQIDVGDILISDGNIYNVKEIVTIPGDYDQAQAFDQIYKPPGRLILQTCYKDGFWFAIALPTGYTAEGFEGAIALVDQAPPPTPTPTELPPPRGDIAYLPIILTSGEIPPPR